MAEENDAKELDDSDIIESKWSFKIIVLDIAHYAVASSISLGLHDKVLSVSCVNSQVVN